MKTVKKYSNELKEAVSLSFFSFEKLYRGPKAFKLVRFGH